MRELKLQLIDLGGEGAKLLEESALIKLFEKCMGLKFEVAEGEL